MDALRVHNNAFRALLGLPRAAGGGLQRWADPRGGGGAARGVAAAARVDVFHAVLRKRSASASPNRALAVIVDRLFLLYAALGKQPHKSKKLVLYLQ